MELKCPNCLGKMQEVLKHGVHLDYCPVCKGVWLDRGEIDKVVQHQNAGSLEAQPHDRELGLILGELRKEGRIS